MQKKTTQLRHLLQSGTTGFIMEAHSGLSARIVEVAGFKGIWGSGLTLSAQHAVRDNNELSWTQVVDTLEFMSDATRIPILLDGDTGYGDFNNMRRLVDKFKAHGVNQITVVAGYRAEAVTVQGIKLVLNEKWSDSGELSSLVCAIDAFGEDTILLYGDLLFRSYILTNLLEWDAPLIAVVDSAPLTDVQGNTNDLAYCDAADDRAMYQQRVSLQHVSPGLDWNGTKPSGRWIGVMRISGQGRQHVQSALRTLRLEPGFSGMGLPELMNQLIAHGHAPQVQYISGHWMDINNLEDLQRAGEFAQGHQS
jgi:choline kinase